MGKAYMSISPRTLLFAFFNLAVAVAYYSPLKELIAASFDNELYSHIVLVPVVSGYFMYAKRGTIFSMTGYSFAHGTVLVVIGIALFLVAEKSVGNGLEGNDFFSLMAFSALVFWTGGFIFFYGTQALRAAAFPLLFLFFAVPLPGVVVEGITTVLRAGSAEAVHGLFRLSGVPFARDGSVFHLPGLSIEVARQCSGIRSSLALLISSVILGHLCLRSGWRKMALIFSILPIAVFKNGLRIVTLSLLGAYLDKRVIHSALHTRGGIPFFVMALALLVGLLWFLRRAEKGDEPAGEHPGEGHV